MQADIKRRCRELLIQICEVEEVEILKGIVNDQLCQGITDSTLNQVATNRDHRLAQSIWIPGTVRMVQDDGSKDVFKNPRLSGGDVSTTGYMGRKGFNTDSERNKGLRGKSLMILMVMFSGMQKFY